MNEDPEVKMSPLCQEISGGGKTISVEIFDDGQGGWLLEVVDEYGKSTVWGDPFSTDAGGLDMPSYQRLQVYPPIKAAGLVFITS